MFAGGAIILAEEVGEIPTTSKDWKQWNVQLYTGMTTTRSNLTHTDIENEYLIIGGICFCHIRITCGGSSSDGAGASLPVPAVRRFVPAGAGGIYGSSPPTQSFNVAIASTLDAVYALTPTNGYANCVSGQEFRATFWYPVAV